jgi:hypothetical protein
VKRANTEREVNLWAAGERGATEAAARSGAPGDADPEPAGADMRRDARTREARGEATARTKRDTGGGSRSASTGWPNGLSASKKRYASCVTAVRAGVPAALKN